LNRVTGATISSPIPSKSRRRFARLASLSLSRSRQQLLRDIKNIYRASGCFDPPCSSSSSSSSCSLPLRCGSVSRVRRFLRARRRLAAILRGSIGRTNRTNTNGRSFASALSHLDCFSFLFTIPDEGMGAREALELSNILLLFRTYVNFSFLSLSPSSLPRD